MFERFTRGAREVVMVAKEEAQRFGDEHIDTHHLLASALGIGDAVVDGALDAIEVEAGSLRDHLLRSLDEEDARALDAIGISLEAVRRKVEEAFGSGALEQAPVGRSGHIPFTRDSKRALEYTLRETLQMGHTRITPAHIVLGVLRTGGRATQILRGVDVDLVRLRQELIGRLDRPDNGSGG